jgi:regulatory protein
MLARQPRSRAELERALVRRGHAADAVAAAIARLDEGGCLDDALVADAVARGAERKKLGSRRVALTLRRRGVAPEVVEQAARASGQGDLERARALLARRFPQGVGASARERERAARLLAARGFPADVVRQALGIDVDVCDTDVEDPDDR